ncbi:lysozyme inhibitor LprI family protein [Virgibacillus soli]|uniref:Lysozyme inhibitor LprI family protein n=1 Tax=Paracerasibacillus soli TaxID=480284 RepID=A0ABU5CWB5_9BACI|nr:lysozyme inhibitor LprI family protein [Virgibacillus soli]MDY0409705.1 lysozyme inhibitor LprI family protein [Virgibacillus soli]
MKRTFVIVSIVGLLLLAACGSHASEKQSQHQQVAQGDNKERTTNISSETADTHDDTQNDKSDHDGNNENADSHQEKAVEKGNTSSNHKASKKEQYLQKLEEVSKKVEKMRDNPVDDTTLALKKVEGDAYDMLDGLLNEVYGVLQDHLPTDKMDELRKEQREWIHYRDQTAKKASLKYEGGTLEQYEYVKTENNLTEKRCLELIGEYMPSDV